MNEITKIAVIGGGAAGLMAAGTATRCGADVTIFEHMEYVGRKIGITGKGRCNLTNACTLQEFMENVPRNPRFLYAALTALGPDNTMQLFEELGVKLKVERARRVFPESDKAATIVNALRKYVADAKILHKKVTSVLPFEGGFKINNDPSLVFDKVILATGGRSYPRTGSDGSGHRIARKLGHTVTPILASLVPLESPSDHCKRMQGLSLKNVSIRIERDGKLLYSDFGEMLFTHFGVSGPMILSASAHLAGEDLTNVTLYIDWKSALDEKTLDERLITVFEKGSNRDFVNALGSLLPSAAIESFILASDIPAHKKVREITKEERKRLLNLLKSFPIPLSGFRPIEEAIVTRGGVEVKEISPKTMESKILPGLYLAGEIIDVDAYTGGYNLQIAFSTGYLAGKSAAEY
ncbi:MAG: NAD(P)/FAD-dependent oxidoreductase [Clostridia bacterium]|nr:NAD(P)/FAD-dependent oxidoreductase [Clostridia bacterium]